MKSIEFHTARNIIFSLWLVFFVPLAIIVTTQTLSEKYDWRIGWGWLAPMTVPILSMMIPIMGAQEENNESESNVSFLLFVSCVVIMILYFLSLLIIILSEPFIQMRIDEIFTISPWFLTPIQGILIGFISKIFLE